MLLEAETGQCHVKVNVNNIVAFEYHDGSIVISCVGGKKYVVPLAKNDPHAANRFREQVIDPCFQYPE
jgi:hypothetical protein